MILRAFTALAALLACSVRAATQLAVGTVSVGAGGIAQVPVTLQSDVLVSAFQADLLISPAVPVLATASAVGENRVTDGEMISGALFRFVSYNLLNSPLQNGTVATLNCTLPSSFTSGSISLTLTNVILSSPAGLPISGVALQNGSIRIGTAVNVQISSVAAANGRLQFQVLGIAGPTFIVESSADLKNWSTLETVNAGGSSTTYSRAIPAGTQHQFFRIRLP